MRKPGGGCPDILKGLTGEMFDIGLRYKKDKVMSKQFGYEIDNVIKKYMKMYLMYLLMQDMLLIILKEDYELLKIDSGE